VYCAVRFTTNNSQFIAIRSNMQPEKLDRLSSLLSGLAPRVLVANTEGTVTPVDLPMPADDCSHSLAANAGPSLRLYVLERVPVELHSMAEAQTLEGPAFWIGPGDIAQTIKVRNAQELARVLSFIVHLEGPLAPLLVSEFSVPRLVRFDEADTLLGPIIALVRNELQEQRCAMGALLNHAGNVLFIGVLRHLVQQSENQSGLFCGLADSRIASTLVAMHESPQLPWTLETLAHRAGMSRTAFALRFKSTLQRTPGKYLSTLRLQIARRKVQSGQGLKAAAHAVGYTNVSALSRALGKCAIPAT
jgi:AraC-like DNA-binding protein